MHWSHFDAETTWQFLSDAGFSICRQISLKTRANVPSG